MQDPARLVEEIHEVCPLPASVQRVMQRIDDPKSNLTDVAAAVGLDAGLAAEVLRLANSPAYGRPRRVDTLIEAVSTLGLMEIRCVAMSMAMLAAFATDHKRVPRMHELSVYRGTFCSAVSRWVGTPPAPAYLAGLLADIGALACLAVDPSGFGAVLDAAAEDFERREILEVETYNTTSRWIGASLLRRNGLPEAVCEAVAAPEATTSNSMLARVTKFARWAAPVALPADGTAVGLDTSKRLADLSEKFDCPLSSATLDEVLHQAGIQLTSLVRAAS